MTINLHNDTAELSNEMGVIIKYYPGSLCSCVIENNGQPDPKDDCTGGYRFKAPIEYKILRTAVNFRKMAEKTARIMQGGSTMTIPRTQEYHTAGVTALVEIDSTVDLTGAYKVNILLDDDDVGNAIEIDMSTYITTLSAAKPYEVIEALNSTAYGEIAYEGGIDGDPLGSGYISVRSLVHEVNGSKVTFLVPSDNDGTYKVFGISEVEMPFISVPSAKRMFLPIHATISDGDVIVMTDRVQRGRDRLIRGTNDTLKVFDIQKIVSVSVLSTNYLEGKDFTLSGDEIVWSGGDAPDTGAGYTVEYLFNTNYKTFKDAPMSRGGDDDQVSKKILLQLRNFIEATPGSPLDDLEF